MQNDAVAARCLGVVKIYRTATGEVYALKGVDVLFPRRGITAIVGPSGSGKSSLLRILAGIDLPTAGSVLIGGSRISGLGPTGRREARRRLIGYVFQRPSDNLIPYLTTWEHINLAAGARGTSRYRAGELLETLGIAEIGPSRPRQLSGGEQQRLAFAQAVIGRPQIVIADEPTAQLDRASGRALLEVIADLAARGTTFVLSTHDPAVVEQADRVYLLRHGALATERHERGTLSVIDGAGRVQLPPEALALFPGNRAVIELQDDGVRIAPP